MQRNVAEFTKYKKKKQQRIACLITQIVERQNTPENNINMNIYDDLPCFYLCCRPVYIKFYDLKNFYKKLSWIQFY